MLVFVLISLGAVVLYVDWAMWVPLLPRNLYEPLLDLGKITDYSWLSALHFLLLVIGLYLLYALGYRQVRAGRARAWLVFVSGALCGLVMVWSYPATAADVFGYIAHGRLLAFHNANPFVVPPSAFARDPIMAYLAFPDEPSQYGPVWVYLGAGIALAARGDLLVEVVLYKALGLLVHLAGGGLVFLVARRLGAERRQALGGAYLFVCNPLLIWEMIGNAHNDGLMLLGGLVAIWLLARGADRLVLPAVAAGALVKLPIAAIAPVLLLVTWRRGRVAAVQGMLLAVALLVVCYWPVWHGLSTLTPLGRSNLFTTSPGSVLREVLQPLTGAVLAAEVARALAYGAFAAVLLIILRRAWRTTSAREAAGLAYATVMAALLVAITWFQAWYLVWPFGLGAVLTSPARSREVVLLSLGGLLQYLVFIYLWVMNVVPDRSMIVQSVGYAALIAPLAVGSLIGLARARWPLRRRRPQRPRRGQAVRLKSA